MQASLTIIDNLLGYDKAMEVRSGALNAGFKDAFFMEGKYQGTGLDYLPDDIAIGVSRFLGRPIVPKIQAFRLGHKNTDLHVNIHADNPIADWASVYYLSLPQDCKGGTAFYSLKETDWTMMPTQEELELAGMSIEDMRDKWQKEDEWDFRSLAGMQFDRLIFYPTRMFHSRYPLKGWGDENKPEHARLVHTMFFDIR